MHASTVRFFAEALKEIEESQAQMGSNPLEMFKKAMAGEIGNADDDEEEVEDKAVSRTRANKRK